MSAKDGEGRVGTLEDACAAMGMRMTEQRRIIARVLDAATDHPDVEELYRRASVIDSRISIATVYRTVKLFEDSGITTLAWGRSPERHTTTPSAGSFWN